MKCINLKEAINTDIIEDIKIRMPVSTMDQKGLMSGGDPSGCIYLGTLQNGKWYRVAVGKSAGVINSALINVGNVFNSSTPMSQLFHISHSGYSVSSICAIAKSGLVIDKIRVLRKGEPIPNIPILDIHISLYGNNGAYLSYTCNLHFKFQKAVEVSDIPDEGYIVDEFTFQ